MKEIWKPVVGWETLYEVSNFGNIRTLHYKQPYLMHPITDRKGYKRVSFVLPNSKKYKRYGVHRVVAEAFIPNPDNLPCVNHKDENKQNNHVDNLEWCTVRYNLEYGTARSRMINSRKGIKFSDLHLYNLQLSHAISQGKSVVQLDKFGNVISEYISISEAARNIGINVNSISHACNGISKSAGGYLWKFKEENK